MTYQSMENSLRNVYKIRQKRGEEAGLGSDVTSTVLGVEGKGHNSDYWSAKWHCIRMIGRKPRKASSWE